MKKNVLITGAAGNLGQAVVDRFKQEGYQVIALVSPGKSNTITDPEIKTYEADLTHDQEVIKLMTTVLTEHQTIHAALLLVGGYTYGGIQSSETAVVKKMIALNFDTAYNVARPIFQHMMEQGGGRIVLVGARPALDAKYGRQSAAYALSKSLVFTLANLLNAEGAEKNVVTSVIAPSTIDTPANRESMPKADFSTWVKAESIAETLSFLVSEKGDALRDPVIKLYGRS
jgi:NAD(P)-dependent dehydrogenase (short-subunit alcohol dehydrogenase family)